MLRLWVICGIVELLDEILHQYLDEDEIPFRLTNLLLKPVARSLMLLDVSSCPELEAPGVVLLTVSESG